MDLHATSNSEGFAVHGGRRRAYQCADLARRFSLMPGREGLLTGTWRSHDRQSTSTGRCVDHTVQHRAATAGSSFNKHTYHGRKAVRTEQSKNLPAHSARLLAFLRACGLGACTATGATAGGSPHTQHLCHVRHFYVNNEHATHGTGALGRPRKHPGGVRGLGFSDQPARDGCGNSIARACQCISSL